MVKSEFIFPEKCAFDEGEWKCSALTKKRCKGCSFFKTEEQLAAGREKAEERIRELSGEHQRQIEDTYHNKVIH